MWFVLSLVKKYYLRQFSLFAWTHVALLCVVSQSYLIIQNMFQVTQDMVERYFFIRSRNISRTPLTIVLPCLDYS